MDDPANVVCVSEYYVKDRNTGKVTLYSKPCFVPGCKDAPVIAILGAACLGHDLTDKVDLIPAPVMEKLL